MRTPFHIQPLSQWTGCLARRDRSKRLASAAQVDPAALTERSWFAHVLPAINQHGPSCCGQAWANCVEAILRGYLGAKIIPTGYQLDGYAIWKRGREKFYGNLDGGLYLEQGFAAALDLGILPPGTKLLAFPDTPRAVSDRLRVTPLVQGHRVHTGWESPDPENGCIDHQPPQRRNEGGHATLRIGLLCRYNLVFYPFLNSWGDWGWKGCGMMTSGHSEETALDNDVYAPGLPDDWQAYDGWKRYLTRTPQ